MTRLLAVLFCAALALPVATSAQPVPEPEGYRHDHYRAPVPDTLAGATVISDAEAHALWQSGSAVFVDVLPRPPKPENLPEGTVWRPKPRHSIPGAIWMPNVGYGQLAPSYESYYRNGLSQITDGSVERPVVLFCLSECWMSWNAAKRAVGWGYSAVHWYPGGTDGWASMDLRTEVLSPMPGEPITR
ncbi:PQQ-dependent catabolism-associated CXXCW motif protein [Phaeobacter sp. B1627]|uniref:PQQ-dependent catabolism-associated CXXCW motif protein n=1 Tax=Phaeobacter sp. B1627 TaxID=2583809 RepID=UPI00111ADABA|nr:PQQ-dependent catabolism-associated CXXCW motif protein [Phaeobacter sp. B1627]TNJ47417.1 PQQ-dependent catabolism-associated CXXCW motif protein [Phaeobacter sp. B1627]